MVLETRSPIDSSDSRYPASGPDHLRRQRSGHQVPADRDVRPPKGAPNVLVDPHRRRGLRRDERVRRSVPDAEHREARKGRAEVHALPHDRVVLADAAGAAHRAQPSLGRHGRHHRNRDRSARLQLGVAQHQGAARAHPQAQWLLDGAVRQVPRGPGVADQSGGTVQRVADRGGGFEYFYGFIGGENNQWDPALYEGTTPIEPPRRPPRAIT